MKDPYKNKETGILNNLLDIKTQEELDSFENAMVTLALTKILGEEFEIEDEFSVFAIHKELFGEVYEWAGKRREINTFKIEVVLSGKSVEYTSKENIVEEINKLSSDYKETKWNELDYQSYITKLVVYISRLWKIHPFREGNTRTITTFLYLKILKDGFLLNIDFLKLNGKYFRNALVMASIGEYSEYNYLEGILKDSMVLNVTDKEIELNENDLKYKTINGIDLENYEYGYHGIKEED